MTRKFIIAISIILSFTISTTHAQFFKGGLIIGLTGSQMDGDMLTGYNKLGITTGFFIRHDISKKLAIQSDYKYVMKGAATNITNSATTGYSQTLHYIEVPLTAIMGISKKIEGEVGLAAAMLMYDSYYNVSDGSYDRSNMNKYDISSIFGITYFYSEKVNVNLKISYSLAPVSHNLPSNPSLLGSNGQFNNVLELAIYYKIK